MNPPNSPMLSNHPSASLLHVGCSHRSVDSTPFAGLGFTEIRFDIDSSVKPDIVGSMTDMSAIISGGFDAIYSSHNIEHLYAHEVDTAFSEFLRILSPKGFVLITCPDIVSVCQRVSNSSLVTPLYTSPAGPISPLDIIYGHQESIRNGNHFMAHRTAFSEISLVEKLRSSGFSSVASCTRPKAFDIWALATKEHWNDNILKEYAFKLLPL